MNITIFFSGFFELVLGIFRPLEYYLYLFTIETTLKVENQIIFIIPKGIMTDKITHVTVKSEHSSLHLKS